MKPVCVPCRRFFRMVRSGYPFLEGKPDGKREPGDGERARAGRVDAHRWTPYKLWQGDRWECPGCGASIIAGTGREPIAEHYQPDFAEKCDLATLANALHGAPRTIARLNIAETDDDDPTLGGHLIQINDC